jgi:hypothetical protein
VSVEDNKSSDATVLMSVKENKSSDGSAEGSVEESKSLDATNDNDGTVPQREVSQPPSVDQMILDLKRKIAVAEGSVEENQSSDASAVESVEESKSMDGTAEESVEESKSSDGSAESLAKPAIVVSLSALSVMSSSACPKADEYQPATQYSPNQGPFTEKNRPRT